MTTINPALPLDTTDYDRDFACWIARQLTLLQTRQFDKLDLDNIIEEFGAMGKHQRRELHSRLETLLMHLLKCQFQPERKSGSGIGTMHEQRAQILRLIEDSPSLRPPLDDIVRQVYPNAVRRAAAETGLPRSTFPSQNPWLPVQLLDPEFIR